MQYELDDWVFNPGSVEMIAMSEYGLQKGFYHINQSDRKLITPSTRPIRRIKMDISSIRTPADLYSKVESKLDREQMIRSDISPLIELMLHGEMNFPKSEISIDRIKDMLADRFKPLWSEVKIIRSNSQYSINEGDVRGLTREQIELRVFSDQVRLDGRYQNNVDEIVKAMIEVKKMAALGIEEAAIQKELRWCFEKIKGRCLNAD